ncbi:MAG TPA: DUF262 domain-containing protein [Longimicrobium sp.]
MRTTATNRKLRTLLTGIRSGALIPRPEFQRRLVWSNRHKVAFIGTVLDAYPFPEIYIAAGHVDSETGEGTEMLVDGQQRITTLYQYFHASSELKLPAEIPPYSNLSEDAKMAFLEYDVVVRDLGPMGIPEIKEIFTRINSTNYALNAMEIQNARFEGDFKKFGETLAENPFFERHRVFSAADIRRMHDLRFVLTLVVTILSTYFNRDDELDAYLARFNDEFSERERVTQELTCVFAYVDSLDFDLRSRVWRKPDLFSTLVELHRVLVKGTRVPEAEAVAPELKKFFARVESINESDEADSELLAYYKASIQATNDRSSRITRGAIIQRVIREASGGQLTVL